MLCGSICQIGYERFTLNFDADAAMIAYFGH